MQHRVIFSILLPFLLAASPAFGADIPLVNHGDSWRYHKGTNAPQPSWTTLANGSLDGTWLTGNGGIGYADNVGETVNCQTLLTDMKNVYTTLYMRREFTVSSSIDPSMRLALSMDYDDGFIAFLDGVYLTSANVSGAPAEPAYNSSAPNSHESSKGNSPPTNPPTTNDLGAVGSRLAVGTHVLAIVGVNNGIGSSDLILVPDLFTTTNAPSNCTNGIINVNTVWRAANSPIVVCGNVTVNSGVTLTIEPGTTVQFASGVGLTVSDGGILLAQGTSNAPIHFTRQGASGNWGHITIDGSVGSPETRISYATFDFNVSDANTPAITVSGGTVVLDHLTFNTTGSPYIHLDSASFVVSACTFPTATAGFELLHGTGGIKSGGRGIVRECFFGSTTGYNDVFDFTGGNRDKGQAILQFYDNVCIGGSDDGLDIDGTDCWIEGNIFLHIHKNGAPDSSSAISGGNTGSDYTEATVIRNIFYDCDHAGTAKQSNYFTFFNNTVVHQSHVGGLDITGAVFNVRDVIPSPATTYARGGYLEGNIFFDIEDLIRNYSSSETSVTLSNNLMPIAWSGPGGGNTIGNPLFKHVPQLSETYFTNWQQAQIMWDWLSLQTNSPAKGTGPNGRDKGAVIPYGASISGEPSNTTTQRSATLVVAPHKIISGPSAAGWPNGSGYTHYKWRLDTNAWSAETPISVPISLASLADGPHSVQVSGKNDAAYYQDDPALGPLAAVSTSRIWTVLTGLKITSASRSGNNCVLHFNVIAGTTYTVEYKTDLNTGPWLKAGSIPAQPASSNYAFTDPVPVSGARFYRIVSPAY